MYNRITYYKQNSHFGIPDLCSQKRRIFILRMKDLNQISASSTVFYKTVVRTKIIMGENKEIQLQMAFIFDTGSNSSN